MVIVLNRKFLNTSQTSCLEVRAQFSDIVCQVIPAWLSPRAPVMTRCWNIWPLHRFVREQQRDETPLCRGSPAMFNGNLLLPRGFCLRLQKCVLSRTGRTSKCSRSQLKPGPLRGNASRQHKMVTEDLSAHAGFTWHLVKDEQLLLSFVVKRFSLWS